VLVGQVVSPTPVHLGMQNEPTLPRLMQIPEREPNAVLSTQSLSSVHFWRHRGVGFPVTHVDWVPQAVDDMVQSSKLQTLGYALPPMVSQYGSSFGKQPRRPSHLRAAQVAPLAQLPPEHS